ncbi:MAG: hypothetical protein BWY09_01674 [Candidatus Hydrogenedentes bacterium ADurb.Bin179]|nr:MAG: hypothetical protein BWY09_01674 [Candidatus Hydrogenedentes bacterium ADurb.Bin179]
MVTDPRDGFRAHAGADRVHPIHQQIRQHGHFRYARQGAREGNIAAGQDQAVLRRGYVVRSGEGAPGFQGGLALAIDHGRRPGPDDTTALFGQLPHHIKERRFGEGFKQGCQRGEPASA